MVSSERPPSKAASLFCTDHVAVHELLSRRAVSLTDGGPASVARQGRCGISVFGLLDHTADQLPHSRLAVELQAFDCGRDTHH